MLVAVTTSGNSPDRAKGPANSSRPPHAAQTPSDRRDEFLMEMYKAAWSNVTTAEDTLWKVMAAYTAVFAALAFVSSFLRETGFVVLVVIFGLFGAAVSQNANLWFIRNMGIIANVEQEFLLPADYERIIPASWKNRVAFVNWDVWWVMTVLFYAVSVTTIAVALPSLSSSDFWTIILIFVAGTILVVFYSVWFLWRSIRNFPKS